MQPDGERRRFCCGVIFRVPDPPVLRVGSPAPASRKVGTKINRKTATTTATKTDPYNSKGRAPGKSHLQGRFGTAHAGANLRRFSGEELLAKRDGLSWSYPTGFTNGNTKRQHAQQARVFKGVSAPPISRPNGLNPRIGLDSSFCHAYPPILPEMGILLRMSSTAG